MTLKFRIILAADKSGFYFVSLLGKYIVTVIKYLQHSYFLQLLHHKLLLNDLLMIDKNKKASY